MDLSIEDQIRRCEERLKQAMLQSNVIILDELLDEGLIFTNHLGQRMNKQDDLKAHNSGKLKMNEITLTDQQIKVIGDVVVVSVKAHIQGVFSGAEAESDICFTRVWTKLSGDDWRVVIAHSSVVD